MTMKLVSCPEELSVEESSPLLPMADTSSELTQLLKECSLPQQKMYSLHQRFPDKCILFQHQESLRERSIMSDICREILILVAYVLCVLWKVVFKTVRKYTNNLKLTTSQKNQSKDLLPKPSFRDGYNISSSVE